MCWKAARVNIGRALMWNLRDIKLTEQEMTILEGRSSIKSNLMQKYVVWRKSSLLLAGIMLSLTAIVSFIGITDIEWEVFNGLGKIALLSDSLSPLLLAIVVWVALLFWSRKPHLSFRVLSYGWIASLVMSLWPLIVPIQYFIDGGLTFGYEDDEVDGIFVFLARVSLAVSYAVSIFPVVITVPSGIIRGGLRIRGLLPECSLAGWLMVITSPLYPLLALVALVLISQLFGNSLLLAGAVFFMIAPSLYIFRRELYTKPKLTKEEISLVNWNQRIIGGLTLLGLFLIAVWALVEGDLEFNIWSLVRFFLSFLGRLFCNTVVFADIIFRMTISSLSEDRIAMENTILGETQGLLQELEEAFNDIKAPRSSQNNTELVADSKLPINLSKAKQSDAELFVVSSNHAVPDQGLALGARHATRSTSETPHGYQATDEPKIPSHMAACDPVPEFIRSTVDEAMQRLSPRDPSIMGKPTTNNSSSRKVVDGPHHEIVVSDTKRQRGRVMLEP